MENFWSDLSQVWTGYAGEKKCVPQQIICTKQKHQSIEPDAIQRSVDLRLHVKLYCYRCVGILCGPKRVSPIDDP